MDTSRTREQSFVSVYSVYSVSTDGTLMWMCAIYYSSQRTRFTTDCFYVLKDDFNVGFDESFANM